MISGDDPDRISPGHEYRCCGGKWSRRKRCAQFAAEHQFGQLSLHVNLCPESPSYRLDKIGGCYLPIYKEFRLINCQEVDNRNRKRRGNIVQNLNCDILLSALNSTDVSEMPSARIFREEWPTGFDGGVRWAYG